MALAGLSAALGFWRGLVSEVIALGAWVVAFMVARAFSPELQPHLKGWVQQDFLQSVLAFVLIFVLGLLLASMARWLLKELLQAIGLGFVDRLLGACFGALRGGLIIYAVALAVGLFGLAKHAWWRGASLSAPLEVAVIASKSWLPAALAQRLEYR